MKDEESIINTWRPIETAPKDGTEILIWDNANVSAVSYSEYVGWTDNLGDFGTQYNSYPLATHWMPLPSPPGSKPIATLDGMNSLERIALAATRLNAFLISARANPGMSFNWKELERLMDDLDHETKMYPWLLQVVLAEVNGGFGA